MAKPKKVEDVAAQMEQQMANYQNMLDDNIAKYEAMVDKAHHDLELLVQAATPQTQQRPEAQWTESNGQKLLVLNMAAAEFFTAIFEQMGKVATELGKIAQQKGK